MFRVMFISSPVANMLRIIGILCLMSLASNVLASPVPLPLALWTADYSLGFVSLNRSARPVFPRGLQISPTIPPVFSDEYARAPRSLASLTQLTYKTKANAGTISNYANESANTDNQKLREQFTTGLNEFNANMQQFQTALTTDKGLANYDSRNILENLLKQVVNANKEVLSSTYTFVNNIPGIGPALGPIVYQLKCLVDGLLDVTEGLTDATINDLNSLLGQTCALVLCV